MGDDYCYDECELESCEDCPFAMLLAKEYEQYEKEETLLDRIVNPF